MFSHQPSTFFARTLSNTIIMIVVLLSALVLTTAAAWEYRLGNNSTTYSAGYIVGRVDVREHSNSPWKYICHSALTSSDLTTRRAICHAMGYETIAAIGSVQGYGIPTPTTMQSIWGSINCVSDSLWPHECTVNALPTCATTSAGAVRCALTPLYTRPTTTTTTTTTTEPPTTTTTTTTTTAPPPAPGGLGGTATRSSNSSDELSISHIGLIGGLVGGAGFVGLIAGLVVLWRSGRGGAAAGGGGGAVQPDVEDGTGGGANSLASNEPTAV